MTGSDVNVRGTARSRVLVTGGAGFIGSHVVQQLLGRGHAVTCFDDLSTGDLRNVESLDATLVRATILDRDALAEAAAGADVIVHLAARPSVPRSISDPVASHAANATGTLQVLETARRLGGTLVIVASSSSVYGANPTLPKHEGLVAMPMSPYAVSKLASEQYALAWSYSYGMPTLAFRFFNAFGPRQRPDHDYAAAIPAFIAAALRNQPLTIFGSGEQTRDFTYVETVAAILVDAAERRVHHDRPVNLAFGNRKSLLEVIDTLEEILGRRLERRHEATRPGDVHDSQADDATLRTLFPNAAGVDLKEGLRRTVEWMDEHLSAPDHRPS